MENLALNFTAHPKGTGLLVTAAPLALPTGVAHGKSHGGVLKG